MTLALMADIRAAVQSARARTGDATIGVETRAGQSRAVRVTYNARGASTVRPVSNWAPHAHTLHTLNTLGA